jgi:hypothetical protein
MRRCKGIFKPWLIYLLKYTTEKEIEYSCRNIDKSDFQLWKGIWF